MARNALQVLDDLSLLGPDTLLFIGEHANENAGEYTPVGEERSNGFANSGRAAVEAAFGLEIAMEAPEATPAEPDMPSLPGTPSPLNSLLSDIVAIDSLFTAKGGQRGPPSDGGGDDGGSSPTVTASFVSGTPDTGSVDNYNIQIDFYGALWVGDYAGFTYDLGEAFIAASEFLSSIIAEGANDVYDMLGNLAYDDLVIEAYITDIDGVGNVLGRAGPTGVRTSDGLTATGLMEFDEADALKFASLGLWDDIVFHEMMHVLGIGTLWDYNNLLQTTSVLVSGGDTRRPTDDVYETNIAYIGTEANAAYDSDPNTFLVVEQDGGSGTAGGHWNEILANGDKDTVNGYDDEIMTGFIDGQNYLSAFSVAALADLGYTLKSTDYVDLASPQSTDIVLESDMGYEDLLLTA